MKKENKKALKSLEQSKSFCEWFGTINTSEKQLKNNLLTTAKGLEQAIEVLKALDELGYSVK